MVEKPIAAACPLPIDVSVVVIYMTVIFVEGSAVNVPVAVDEDVAVDVAIDDTVALAEDVAVAVADAEEEDVAVAEAESIN